MKKLYFDMDGTVADLYGSADWLYKLRNEVPGAFRNLEPLHDMVELERICKELIADGWELGIITWLPIDASKKYEAICTAEKIEWANKYMPYITDIIAQPYGTPKHTAPQKRAKMMVIVDDNDDILQTWATPVQRKTIDAKINMLEELKKLLA